MIGPEDLVRYNDDILITASYDRISGGFNKRDSLLEGEIYAIYVKEGVVEKVPI